VRGRGLTIVGELASSLGGAFMRLAAPRGLPSFSPSH
jgi:hypothetical protein